MALVALLMALGVADYGRANVFGDGKPDNGNEDDRRTMMGQGPTGDATASWQKSAGTIFCDGKTRGSAVILDVSDFSGSVGGIFLATAAHVFFDLDEGQRFKDCRFHYLALDQLAKYHAPIEDKWVRMGRFDPVRNRQDSDFGKEDWAFIHLPRGWLRADRAGRLKPRRALLSDGGGTPIYRFIGYDRKRGEIIVSGPCSAVQSVAGDLGGGQWTGQYLDDCDSGNGASGGGLIARQGQVYFLVGIRAGSHWSPEVYPPEHFPHGPPDGSAWDVRLNTNFARAIDQSLIIHLATLVREAESSQRSGRPPVGGR